MSEKPYLKRLLIKQFRNIRPGTEVFFNPGFNILLGKNGTGKTTLLEIISCFMRGDFSPFKNDEFQLEIEVFHDKKKSIIASQSTMDPQTNSPSWMMQAAGSHEPVSNILKFFDQSHTSFLHASFERFDESLDTFSRLVDAAHPKHVKIDVRFQPEKSVWAYAIPDSILERFLAAPEVDLHPFVITNETRNEITTLAQFTKMIDAKNTEMEFQGQTVYELGRKKIIFDAIRFNIYYPNRDQRNHTSLSYGQKRLLSFLYYIECNPHMIIADEMSNGFHYDWIEECMELIKDRQCFLTSQNPILVDHLHFDEKSQIQNAFIKCYFDDEYRTIWSNFTGDDVDDFWGAYQVKIQNVSEILRAKGLW